MASDKPDQPANPQQPATPKPDETVVGSETTHLVRQAKSGDSTRAWTPLSDKIVYYLRTRFGNAGFPPGTEFDDFVSDMMARIMTSIGNFEDRGNQSFWRWVQTIGGNLWRDMWRRFERDRKLGIAGRGEVRSDDEESSIHLVDSAPVVGDTPTGIVRFRELEQAEQECVARLPKTLREVYIARRVHEMSFADISASGGGVNHATLRSHYMRARDSVRDCLARRIDELGKTLTGWR
ncbi:MAG: RNA polymerase sigma factor [bacterium]|nr:RNA polymerase sigma factor [bacterium]